MNLTERDLEPIELRPSPPARSVRKYRITYRDSAGDLFEVYADEITRHAYERQLRDCGYAVAVEEQTVHTSVWRRVA
ncbi:hypothetical protein [Nocardia flavorosea]|uniref:Uncharacterized protein n=1 Tax=Nocardia flavorosea TaxID=53429 RepID=A0A846YSH3_9NOCA|nr:hypothetical protein [Nocardia flavorosea]NKY60388.1 hypothetical protein [Nocardia flavorosea]